MKTEATDKNPSYGACCVVLLETMRKMLYMENLNHYKTGSLSVYPMDAGVTRRLIKQREETNTSGNASLFFLFPSFFFLLLILYCYCQLRGAEKIQEAKEGSLPERCNSEGRLLIRKRGLPERCSFEDKLLIRKRGLPARHNSEDRPQKTVRLAC